jgi:hypothetical protein
MTPRAKTLPLLALAASAATAAAVDCTFSDSYPRQYVAYALPDNSGVVVDGRLDEPAWQEVAFTEDFVDISTTTTPRFRTRVKIRWSPTHLFVGAVLEDTAVWANITAVCHCVNASQDQVRTGGCCAN